MQTFNWQDFAALAPAVILVAGGCVLLLSEVFLTGRERGYQAWLSAAVAGIAGAVALGSMDAPAADLFGGLARRDAFGSFAIAVACFTLLLASLSAHGHLKEMGSERGEFHALAQFATAGMAFLVTANDLVTLFVALEVMSLATYGLAAWLRTSGRPSEAALKYFVLGSFASAIFVYGAALAWGAAGSTRLTDIAAVAASPGGGPAGLLLWASLALMATGFFFKVAAVPFHMWAPDVYEGSPTPVTGFMAAGVKTAAFAVLVRVLVAGFGPAAMPGESGAPGWLAAVSAVAMLTMIAGNLLAVPQRSVKRMLAYSSIAHAGYLLTAVAAAADAGARAGANQALLFYLAMYAASALGAFAVVAALERRGGPDSDADSRYDGLAQRHPVLALAMAVFLLSLAGVPPMAGFAGKLFLFRAAMQANLVGLVVVGVLTSVVGLYYYLRIIVRMYMRPAPEGAQVATRTAATGAGLAIAAAATIVFGIGPWPLTELARVAATVGR